MNALRTDTVARSSMIDFGLAGNSKNAQVKSMFESRPVFESVETWMRFFGFPNKDIFAFRLALEEAVANALKHGRCGDRTRSVEVSYAVFNDEAIAEVSDGGRGFDPSRVPNPLAAGGYDGARGLGLYLMRAYSSWMTFNREGNVVTLCRCRSES